MPYKDREIDREKHREYMRQRRQGVTKLNVTPSEANVTPDVTPDVTPNNFREEQIHRVRQLVGHKLICGELSGDVILRDENNNPIRSRDSKVRDIFSGQVIR